MEFSWSALWNITDETPDNCEMFLNFNGMKLFLECLKVLPVPSASGLLGRPRGRSAVPGLPADAVRQRPPSPRLPWEGWLTGPPAL